MPTELEELVEFLHHGNTQIRQIAAENLVGYSTAQPSLFKSGQLTPIKDLKLLIKDYAPIAKNAITMLINLSDDPEILQSLATDDDVLESLLLRITNDTEPNANEMCMLLANLAKHDSLKRLITFTRALPKSKNLSTSRNALDQLTDCFVKGAAGSFNPSADYDYLSYLFADLAKYPEGRSHLVTARADDEGIIPLTKLIVFTEHNSDIRRRGVASTIKNVCFSTDSHALLLSPDGVNLLPYILLPLMGGEEYSDEDMEGMLDDLQLLPPDKAREGDAEILKTHLDSLLLLTTTRAGRDLLRRVKVYPVVRECHLQVEEEGVREGCDRVVQVLLRDEEEEGKGEGEKVEKVEETKAEKVEEVDEDEMLVEV